MDTQKLRILIVDDDEDDIVLTKELIAEGMKDTALLFYEAHNFKEAVSIIDKNRYDICIFDYRLNEVHGIDLLRTVRAKGITTPVILLTGQGEEDIAVDAMKSGATDYIVKGKLSSDSLCASIRYALELYKKEELNRKMEEELKKVSKLESIGALAGGIAHEFNNLLTGVIGNISLAKMYASPEDEIFKSLAEAEKASLRAKDIARQLLTFSRGGAPIKKAYPISELLKESSCLFFKGSNVQCDCSLPDDLYLTEIDEGQIKHAIANIIANAREAMPEGGVVRICAENMEINVKNGLPLKDGKYVKISFEDSGIGIPKENLNRIFDPFFTTKEKKSGIGLSTAYSIVKKHNGYITAESKLGMGTTIYIYLPAVQIPLNPPFSKGDLEFPPLEKGGEGGFEIKRRILVMDDEEVVRDVAGKMLERIGYEVDFAKDGIEAIELYKKAMETKRPYNAVIMDLTIPGGMGGKEAIKRLKEIDPSVKAIVSSGYSNDDVMAEFREYGFSGVVAKPYSLKELGEIVEKVCRKDS
ncbi:MAG: response regulator [Nitrospinae bacterium]|nr:response regulator [Nitrospinota bacterium]MBI3812879.1 response regulator [Nitrospinota bacterium]